MQKPKPKDTGPYGTVLMAIGFGTPLTGRTLRFKRGCISTSSHTGVTVFISNSNTGQTTRENDFQALAKREAKNVIPEISGRQERADRRAAQGAGKSPHGEGGPGEMGSGGETETACGTGVYRQSTGETQY